MTLDPILKTKLFIPPPREGLISRKRLTDLLDTNITKKVSFISAPAGFGKSTLLSEWASESDLPVCCVSLDPSEDDPVKFLSYLVSSVQTIWEDLGDPILSALQAPGSPPVDFLLNSWINELSEYTSDFVLILDDFHHIKNQEVLDLLSNLTDHQPYQLHLLIASRADLPISCSRLRARGDIGEIDITEMRFTIEESVDYLQSQLGDRITVQDAQTLSQRTEGWIVGLHMAVLSMRSCEDIPGYVAQFSAADRYVTDYLLDEILLRQPEEVENFLLMTSILDKFTAPLCDAITDRSDSQKIIDILVRSGMFTIPLDTTHTWHRYHHLFAELLRTKLSSAPSFSVESLHRRASDWFAAEGMLEESIAHAFAIEDYPLVILRIEDFLDQIMAQGKFRNYLNWVDHIPSKFLDEKPRINIVKIFMLYEMGRLDGLGEKIAGVETLLGPFPDELEMCSRDELINFGIFASIRTIIFASSDFNVDETFRYAALASRLLPESFRYWRTLAIGAIPFLYRALGNYEKSLESHKELLEEVLDAEFLFLAFITYSVLTKAYLETGKLKLALITCEEAIDLDREHDASLPFAKYAYILMGQLLYHSGQLDAAETYIEQGLEQVVRHGEVFSIIEGYSTLIMIQFALGDNDQAIALNKEMKQVISEIPSNQNSLSILNIWDANINLQLGKCDQANLILDQVLLEEFDNQYMFDIGSFSYVGIYRVSQTPIRVYLDFLELTRARVFLCQNQYSSGLEIVEKILARIATGGNRRYQVEALIVKSMLLLQMSKKMQAVQVFQDAIALASKEGYIQIFFNEGVSIHPLVEAVRENPAADIEQRLFVLRLWENLKGKLRKQDQRVEDHLVHLTPREIEVLACLASGTSYSQAAETLSISRNTLKTHTKRIYQKLGVNGLLQALNEAKRLNLIS
jgi:LuxR family maltose regulon positive regulatory protein